VTSSSVELAYIRSNDLTEPSETGEIRVLSAPIPVTGIPFSFGAGTEYSAVTLRATDPVSIGPGRDPILYSPVELLTTAGNATVLLAHVRSANEVSVAERTPFGDSRVDFVEPTGAGDGRHRNAVISSMTLRPVFRDQGYAIAFRSTNGREHVAYADSRSTELFLAASPQECPEFFRTVSLAESALQTRFLNYDPVQQLTDPLWDQTCPGVNGVTIPEDLAARFDERVGRFESFLFELLAFVVLKDGRGLLKHQSHVCIPNSINRDAFFDRFDEDACDPGRSGDLLLGLPPVPVDATVTEPTPFAFVQGTPCDPPDAPCACDDGQLYQDRLGTFRCVACPQCVDRACMPSRQPCACAPGGQLMGDEDTGFFCRQCLPASCGSLPCPDGAFFDPAQNLCAMCLNGNVDYSNHAVGAIPAVIDPGETVECRTCPADRDPAEGRLSWILSADGTTCTRCPDGGRLLPCNTDRDCEGVFGPNSRCADTDAWDRRFGAPTTRACLAKCTENAHCPAGICDVEEGVCRTEPEGDELASGMHLFCRPIGCDSCWNNDFCENDAECPVNHTCTGDDRAVTPLCLARPILDVQARNLITDPTLRADLEAVLQSFGDAIASARLPHGIDLPDPLGSLQDLDGAVRSFDVRLQESPGHQGTMDVVFDIPSVVIRHIDIDTITLTDVSITFQFEPYIVPRTGHGFVGVQAGQDRGDGYTGLAFSLKDVDVSADILGGIPVGSLVEGSLGGQVGPLSSRLFGAVLSALGVPGPIRCAFVSSTGDLDALPRACPEGGDESEHLVHVTDEALQISVRRCLDDLR
jgi:hypothetical protein